MMNKKLLGCVVSLLGLLIVASSAEVAADKSKTLQDRLSAAVTKAELCAKQAVDYRDIAVLASENAVAARNDAERSLVDAMKSGKKKRIKMAKKALKEAQKEAKSVHSILEALMEHVSDCLTAVVSVKEHSKSIAESKDEKDLESMVKKVERLVDAAAKSAEKAGVLAEKLKKKWLLSVLGVATTTTTTTTTTQPPTPTPIGRR